MNTAQQDTSADGLLHSVDADTLAEVLRSVGCRVAVLDSAGSAPRLRSAAQGLGFYVSFGRSSMDGETRHLDFTFHCPLTVQGELGAGVVADWNQTKRFARLSRQGELLVLAMDVLVAGGVGAAHLRAQCELWDHLLQQLVLHLKQPAAGAADSGGR